MSLSKNRFNSLKTKLFNQINILLQASPELLEAI